MVILRVIIHYYNYNYNSTNELFIDWPNWHTSKCVFDLLWTSTTNIILIWIDNRLWIMVAKTSTRIVWETFSKNTDISRKQLKNYSNLIKQGSQIIITVKMERRNNRKVQVFECTLQLLASMGLKPNQRLLNGRVLCEMLVYVLNFISCAMFVISEANTFWEYTNSIFILMAAVVAPLLFILLTINSAKMFKLMEFFREIFEDSK